MINAVIYARYSSAAQRSESIEQQLEVCHKYAAEKGFRITNEYCDYAMSGTSDERPEFQRMIEDAETKTFQRVIVYKLDRFARDRYDSAVYKHRLKKLGVQVVSATEAIPDTSEGILLEAMLEGTAEFYSRQLAENVKRGMTDNAKRCLANGCHLYGYSVGEDGRYVINEKQAYYIREAFRLRAQGLTVGAIAQQLHEQMGTTYKRAWNVFSRAFRNKKYMGTYLWGDIVIENGMPAIVTKEEFEGIQGMKARPKRSPYEYPLSGSIVDTDGNAWHGEQATSRGHLYRYYSDGKNRVRCEVLEQQIFEMLVESLKEDDIYNRILNGVKNAAEEMTRNSNERPLSQAKKELENLNETARMIGADESLAKMINQARNEVETLERKERMIKASAGVTLEGVKTWFDEFMTKPSASVLISFIRSVTVQAEGSDVVIKRVEFNYEKGAGLAPDSFGTPIWTTAKLVFYPQGFALVA